MRYHQAKPPVGYYRDAVISLEFMCMPSLLIPVSVLCSLCNVWQMCRKFTKKAYFQVGSGQIWLVVINGVHIFRTILDGWMVSLPAYRRQCHVTTVDNSQLDQPISSALLIYITHHLQLCPLHDSVDELY